jgi:acetyltransferase-like isoleucine patch superfamily enzyme
MRIDKWIVGKYHGLLARLNPPPPYRIADDAVILGMAALTLGDRTVIASHAKIDTAAARGGKISIGDRTYVHTGAMILSYGGEIAIGANCSVNPYSILYGHGGLTIGNDVRIAAHVVIVPGNHVFEAADVPIREQGTTGQGIVIEDDVWIGAHATVLDGVRVGKGAVIGAGSVVTRSIEPYHVVAGNPAKTLRIRGEQAPE